ncbi:hypothetical protein [Paludisphaera soli]|uniref:hypothetical protein n=1 Tax=Paludisphaera soli TaxID=2712865 RepID=UPI0013EA469B|nr:hypothetical protein [Paludisphaera soli]
MRSRQAWTRRRIVALASLVVGPIGLGFVLVRPSPPAFILAYPAFLAWFAGGLTLALMRQSWTARWWLISTSVALVPMLALWLVARRSPEALLDAFWLVHASRFVIVAWLAAWSGVAAFGWWIWARDEAPTGEHVGGSAP